MIKAMRHTGIVVKDIEKEINFYVNCLGFKIQKDSYESGSYIDEILNCKGVKVRTVKMCLDEGSMLELLYFQTPEEISERYASLFNRGYTHISLTVTNIDEAYENLKKAGIEFNSKPIISPDGYAKVVFCRDPEGNYIEFVQVLNG